MTVEERERIMQRMRELRREYLSSHHAGMAALEQHDFPALDAAIARERTILDEQRQLINQLNRVHQDERTDI